MKRKKTVDDSIYEAIFEIVRLVPKGRITSYGAVAQAVGLKSGARLVGHAMNKSTGVIPAVPVHRVVNSVGILSGEHDYRQKKLEAEGLVIVGDRIMNFKNYFWDPLLEL